MAGYMAKLGGFVFGLNTAGFQQLDRRSSHDWAEQKRIGRKPAMQSTGPGADTISLQGVIYPHFRGGLGQVGAMRAMQGSAEPLALIYAFESAGQYCGRWCIKEISEGRTVFFSNGAPRKIEFSLELVEYGEDADYSPGEELTDTVVPVAGGSAADAGAVLSASNAAAGEGAAMSTAGRLGDTMGSISSTIGSAYDAFTSSGPGQILRTVVMNGSNILGVASNLSNWATAIEAAKGNPSAMFDALQGAAGAAGSASNVLGTFAGELGLNLGFSNGSSGSSLFSEELSTSIGDMRELATSCGDLKSAADILSGKI